MQIRNVKWTVVLAVVAIALTLPAFAGAKEGDDAIGVSYGWVSPEVGFDTREVQLGASWAHWWKDRITTEVGLTRRRAAGSDYSATIDGAYHVGPLFIGAGVGYVENAEGANYNGLVGLNFWGGPINLKFEGRYVLDPSGAGDLSERSGYQASGAIRLKF